jgi:hypothetical protein
MDAQALRTVSRRVQTKTATQMGAVVVTAAERWTGTGALMDVVVAMEVGAQISGKAILWVLSSLAVGGSPFGEAAAGLEAAVEVKTEAADRAEALLARALRLLSLQQWRLPQLRRVRCT